MQNWLASEAGQRYTATRKRLSHIRATIEKRWEEMGYEDLSNYEQEYINVWWLRSRSADALREINATA